MFIYYSRIEDTSDGVDFHLYLLGHQIIDMQMDFIPNPILLDVPHPILLDGVAQCKGYRRQSWINKCVILTNELEVDVARGICYNANTNLVIDNDGMPLSYYRIVVETVEALLEEDVSLEWVFSMRVWHICKVFLNGASLYDHDQQHIYNAAVQALNRHLRRDIWQYDLER
jgi:hypothetical protein